ncbi:MAG: hypothetical protein HY834_08960 [Devosia nanyangense]|uniref:Uncharacterized protein n=1 Tax=Devosia nanyangense TaxID=1228055 RepID=A0A933L3N0_9HYPH|nr:hypothetical protein [Devosia nanyangense]
MADMTLAECDAAIAELRAVKRSRLLGGVRTRTDYVSGGVSKEFATMLEIDGEIARLEVLRARLNGGSSGGGPIRIGFGPRI